MDDVTTPSPTSPAPTPAPAPPPRGMTPGSAALALLTGAVVALAGGVLWAVAEIVTDYDIGFLAWFIGVVTALAMLRVAGGAPGLPLGIVAGVLAAAAIIVGKYVVYAHELRKLLANAGVHITYWDTREISDFFHNFSTFVHPIYYLWLLLALAAAIRTAVRHQAHAQTPSFALPAVPGVRRGMRQCTKEGCELRYVPVGPTTSEVCEKCGSPTQQTSVSVVS